MRFITPLFIVLSLLATLPLSVRAATLPLVSHSDQWSFHKGTNAPQADWKTAPDTGLNSALWSPGNGGFGYANNGGVTQETNNCGTILADMYNRYATLYIRRQFDLTNAPAPDQKLYLRMDYDDGFIAWLDGTFLYQKNSPGGTTEPAYNAIASADHESSLGNNGPNPAETYDLGFATNWLAPGTHTLAILGLNGSSTSSDFIQVADLYLDSPVPPTTNVWALSNSPISITASQTIPANTTLLVEPGVTVNFAAGVRVIANGQVLAAGTPEKRIRLTRSGSTDWSGFSFSGNHQTNVFTYVDFEYANGSGNGGSAVVYINDSNVTFDRDTFFNLTGTKYMDIWYPQVIIRHSVFGDVGASYMFTVENLASNGWFLVDGNLFGLNTGDNDIFHLNHISVKDGPKAVLLNNVFTGAGDDHIDDNESDSHIEGNLFLNFTTNHPPRSASCAVTTGEGSGVSTNLHTQRLVVVRNVFWGCDYGIINKDGSALEVYNCVFVNNRGGIIFDEPWRTDSGPGRSCYIEGSIFWNNWPENGVDQGTFAYVTNSGAWNTGRYYRGATQLTVNNSILPARYHYLGQGNLDVDPMFNFPTNLGNLSPTNPVFAGGFDGFDANAFLLTNHLVPDLHLLPGSPAIGSSVNGADMGIYVSDDATLSGEPASPTSEFTASLIVAGLDVAGYKYRLVGPGFTNAWSDEFQSWKYISAISISGTTALATATGHGFSNQDLVQITGADSLCPYYNGRFVIRDVTTNTFSYTVAPGTNLITSEPLNITWPIRNERRTDIWVRKPQPIQLADLTNGTWQVQAIRKNSMDVWQNRESPTLSKAWTITAAPAPLTISSVQASSNGIIIQFEGLAGQSYTLEYSDSLAPAAWRTLRQLSPLTTSGQQSITDSPLPLSNRFYRLTSP